MNRPTTEEIQNVVVKFYEHFGLLPPVHKSGEANLAGMVHQLVHAGIATAEDVQIYVEHARAARMAAGAPELQYDDLPFPPVYR